MRHPRNQSRVTNGKTLLPGVRKDSVFGRIMADTLVNLISHCGGAENLSATQQLSCRRIAFLEADLVFLESAIAECRNKGETPTEQLDLYCRLTNAQRRSCETVGWQRTPRDLTPDLRTYLASTADKEEELN